MARPSAPVLLGIFLRTALRRFGNRYLLGLQKIREARAAKKGRGKTARQATEHRQQSKLRGILGSTALASLIIFFIGFQTLSSFRQASEKIHTETSLREKVIPLERYEWVVRHDQNWKDFREKGRLTFPSGLVGNWSYGDAESHGRFADHYERHGLAGFRQAEENTARQGEVRWMGETMASLWFRSGGLLAACAALYIAGSGLGLLNKNINSAEPALLWLFDFPVPRVWLFAARVAESTFDNIGLILLSLLPAALIWQAGAGLDIAALGGAGFGVLLALNMAALRVVSEVFLLQNFRRRVRGVVSGLVTILSVVMIMVLLYGGQSPQLARLLLWCSENFPPFLFWSPFQLGLGTDPAALASPFSAWLPALGVTVAFSSLCVAAAAWLTRGGFESAGESAPRVADVSPAASPTASWLSPLIRRELLRLRRQPSVLIQMMAAPGIVLLIQYFQNGGFLVKKLAGSADSLAATIYGFSVYLVLTSGMSALTQEIKCAAFMLSLPASLAEGFRAAARLAGSVAIGLALTLTVSALVAWPGYAPGLLPRLPFILLFLWLLAELLRGIQLLGMSILSDTRVTLTARSNYLTMILAASAGHAVHGGDLWTLTVMASLIGLLNFAVWQKVRAELPYLTEPVEDPPPRLHLMHGMMALFFFFVGQNIAAGLALGAGASPAKAMILAYVLGGFVVGSVTVFVLFRDKVPWWPAAKGRLAPALRDSALAFLAPMLLGVLWLTVLKSQGPLPESPFLQKISLFVLAVVAAPIFEEIIFRGLVYQGLRQNLRPFHAILLSSLLFTIVHPGMSAPCVFLLAFANALLLERTGRLWACMLVHAAYNAVVLNLQ